MYLGRYKLHLRDDQTTENASSYVIFIHSNLQKNQDNRASTLSYPQRLASRRLAMVFCMAEGCLKKDLWKAGMQSIIGH